jgi:hypothetical protein
VQVYVDDIVFGGSSNSLVARFAEDMSKEFGMSMMVELQFFLGLQIKQSKEGTFVHQAKYTKDIVRNFKMEDSKAMATPMSTTIALDADEEGEHVDQKEYRSMIGSLLYLTVTRPDIQFSVSLCAGFQASPRTSHQQAVKRIFRYLRPTPDFGLWYSTSSSLSLHGFSDADFARCWLDRKSTSGTCQFLGSSLVSWSSLKQSNVAQSTTEAEYVATVLTVKFRQPSNEFTIGVGMSFISYPLVLPPWYNKFICACRFWSLVFMQGFGNQSKTSGISSSSTLGQDLEARYKSCNEANLTPRSPGTKPEKMTNSEDLARKVLNLVREGALSNSERN